MTILSFKILRYNFFVNSFIPYVTTPDAILRYGLTDLQVAALNEFLKKWNDDFANYVNPLASSKIVIDTQNGDYQTGFTLTQSIRSLIKNNTTITLSSEERVVCEISKPGSSGTSGVPKYSPSIACMVQSSLSLFFLAINPALMHSGAKPPGIAAIGFKIAITDAGAPIPPPEAYVRQENETSTYFEMLFTSAQVGKTLYIIGFYINGKGVAGKDGIPCVVTIV